MTDFLSLADLPGDALPALLDDAARSLADLDAPSAETTIAVMVCGSGRYLQVWDKEAYESLARTPRDFARGLPTTGGAAAAKGV